MEVFVARQPIYTRHKDIFAYELLYRQSYENKFIEIDGDLATTDVIINSFINIGMDTLTDGRPCFINFTMNLLNSDLPTYLNPREVVVEILETIELTDELVRACKGLKARGYRIALDDFVLETTNPFTNDLLTLADIVKVDFRTTSYHMRSVIETLAKRYHFRLLAEKVETLEEFEGALKAGYQYFQGYFFSKPIIVSSHDIPEYIRNCFSLITHLSKDEPNLTYVTQLIEQDLSLSFKLLKLINSAAFRGVSKINSIRQAIVRLGFNELIKWLYILSLRDDSNQQSDWSNEMFNSSLVRAKACELIASRSLQTSNPSSYFLTGLFSLMDVLLSMEMVDIVKRMPLEEGITEALTGTNNGLRALLILVQGIEKGRWAEVSMACKSLQLDEVDVLKSYTEAFEWAQTLVKSNAS